MTGFSRMLSFEIKGELKNAVKFVESLEISALAGSPGVVEFTIKIPALMTHPSILREKRLRTGIKDNLIRVSVGIEYAADLIEDLERGFKSIKQ